MDPSEANLIDLKRSNVALVHALTLESEYWKQKSNCKWLEAGERNTKYFHSLVKKKRLKSKIHRIMEENQEVTIPDQIIESATTYFKNLLSYNPVRNNAPEFSFQFPQVSEECTRIIGSLPTDEEIRDTVFSIDKDSVAGLDGFSSAFYQACWDFIAIDIFEAVKDFFHRTQMPRSFTATTIVLVPKVESPQTWNDFRPISLCNVTNKILSKLIYNKLHNTLPDLIFPSQSGFVPGRLIGDNILMAQEMIHQLDLRYNKGNLVIKLDMSKAYDRVNWNFLLTVLQKMGFPHRFLTLIKHAIQNCWFTVLVNGETTGFFKSFQGLRQGDPLSPALFILAAEALSRGLDLLFNENLGMFYRTNCEVKISHLSYADDVILFTNCEEESLTKLMQFLRNFEESSGQKINHAKSAFIPEKKANLMAHRIKHITGFSRKALPITYLGAPLYKGNKKKILYENLIDKVRNKIAGWEHCHLSYGGRLQLIKTVLSSMPIYLLQVLNPPVGTIQKLEQLFAKYFWGSTSEQRKIHWTKWQIFVILSKKADLELGTFGR
ncbi:UNVERIFIED_CONTAM: hypothetical protein Sindi_0947900 [Sesamum indicum]